MRIVNTTLLEDILAGRTLRLDLGSGLRKKRNHYGLDIVALPGVDIVADLNKPLDQIPDDSVSSIYSNHTFEHVSNLLGLMQELYRIAGSGARIEIIVPHFSNPYGYSDPTHVRFFGLYTFYYFSDTIPPIGRTLPRHYAGFRFDIKHVHFSFYRDLAIDRLLAPIVERLVNRGQYSLSIYERHFCWFYPAHQITFMMEPYK